MIWELIGVSALVSCATLVLKKSFRNALEVRACPQYAVPENSNPQITFNKKEIRVLLLGDTGSGNEFQKKVACQAEATCREKGCDFAILLGDNFIQDGVTDVHDPQWKSKFEDMYSLEIPFYAILGNHDLKGNWRAQIDYTELSKRWRMPANNYEIQAGPVLFQAINTTCTVKTLTRLLKKKSAPWRVALGHHPIISSGRHGGMIKLERFFVNRSGIQFFISGHNHVLEHTIDQNFEQIISGGGGSPIEKSKRPRLETTRFFVEEHGYIWARFTEQKAQFEYYNASGQQIYHFERTRNS